MHKESKNIKVAVLGATGFTGEKLVEILLAHPFVELTYLCSRTPEPVAYSKLFPRFLKKTDLLCEPLNVDTAVAKADVLFLSLPHTVSMQFAPLFLNKGKKVIDLSADYRLHDTKVYEKYYKTPHLDVEGLKNAVYGLPELFHDQIASASLIANPGCYPTSIILGLFPLVKENVIEDKVIINSCSAITGAGRKAVIEYHYSNIADNIWAYKPFVHQHIPEVSEVLKVKTGISVKPYFTPHVAPVAAGIYSTIFVTFKKKTAQAQIQEIFKRSYAQCPFIRVLSDALPKLKDTSNTNFCDIGIACDPEGENAVIVSSIDNLIKGAAGQAVQNMNIILGFDETLGLL